MPSTFPHPRVELLATSSLKCNPRNAKLHSAKQIGQIGASIERFGWLVPLVIDDDNMIAAGHGRFLAAKRLGLTEVPVIRARFLTDDDRRAFALAENKIAQLSSWDEDLLAAELEHLFDVGFELQITGFSTADLDFSLPPQKGSGERVELPAPHAVAVSRLGDLWQIGPHRIYCGDARDVASYEALLGDERAAIAFVDPPYNVRIDGFVAGKGRHREFVMGAGEMSAGEFTAFLRPIFRNLVRFSKPASIHYVCMDWRHIRELLDAADGVYSEFKQLVVWDKGVGGQGAFYRSQHELVFVFKSGKGQHINTFGLGEKGRARDLDDHSTVKSTALVADFLLDCSLRGDLVLDACLGSGTTLLAAHKTKRRGAGIELDPLYVDTALKRLIDATGLTPTLTDDGRSFAEIRAERAELREG